MRPLSVAQLPELIDSFLTSVIFYGKQQIYIESY